MKLPFVKTINTRPQNCRLHNLETSRKSNPEHPEKFAEILWRRVDVLAETIGAIFRPHQIVENKKSLRNHANRRTMKIVTALKIVSYIGRELHEIFLHAAVRGIAVDRIVVARKQRQGEFIITRMIALYNANSCSDYQNENRKHHRKRYVCNPFHAANICGILGDWLLKKVKNFNPKNSKE